MIDFKKVYEEETGKSAYSYAGVPTIGFAEWLKARLVESTEAMITYFVPCGIKITSFKTRISEVIERNTGMKIDEVMK